MRAGHKYTLEKGSRKHHCPDCGKKTLVRYKDTQTGEYVPEQYGRCDREIKCSYFNPPPSPEQQEIKCLFVPFSLLNDYSTKAFRIKVGGKIHFLPKTVVFEVVVKGCYVSEWYLNNTARPPAFINNNFRHFSKGERIEQLKPFRKEKAKQSPTPTFIPKDVLRQTLQGYEQNVFLQNLLSRVPFPIDSKRRGKGYCLVLFGYGMQWVQSRRNYIPLY
jgi:predicted RNA-binding Zn-ribbon protein involved in translation (DUF1610 family)